MKRSTGNVLLASVGIAVVLTLVATWLEDDSRWMPPQVAAPPPIETPRSDSPLRVSGQAARCDSAEGRLKQQVDESRACANDDDCTLFDYGYPIQCLTSVAKSHITALRLEYRNYEQSCAFRVYYDCPTGDVERVAVCRQNRCEVALENNEVLTEETLEYLRIRER